ncbi:ParB/RepB/Spo0J family partition protein [Clostridium gasigenes]|uniref:ParB/RepB/Spo0J family partition protein n=1 Tax=Clostridium gasigenes TaxID=94869 RepID=UPI001C0B3034|nr:ParB/RepB/Spo0J family partition protein [Clostridium gasigenes]MBU3131869.1 ParB/RepB/Spo0J family partition protein [Clostridium gasigenes]
MGKNKFNKFVETIKKEGIKEPIKYVEYNGKKYVVDGHHRLQAAKRAGIGDVPVEKVDLPYLGYKTIEDLLWSD